MCRMKEISFMGVENIDTHVDKSRNKIGSVLGP